jgi:hypothetical protein
MKKLLKLGVVGVALAVISLKACSLSGSEINGVVRDEATGQPIADAIVVATWPAYVSKIFAESGTMCAHVDTARSDKEGRFHMASWTRPFSSQDVRTSVQAPEIAIYKPGYIRHATEGVNAGQYTIKRFVGSKVEYFDTLGWVPRCAEGGQNQKYLYQVFKIAIDDIESVVETKQQTERLETKRRSAEGMLVDRSKPTFYRGGFTENVDKSDNYNAKDFMR